MGKKHLGKKKLHFPLHFHLTADESWKSGKEVLVATVIIVFLCVVSSVYHDHLLRDGTNHINHYSKRKINIPTKLAYKRI